MIAGLVSIDSPCSEYSGNTTRSIVGMLRRALPTSAQMRSHCVSRSAPLFTTGSCSCTSPITTPFGDLFSPPSPLIASLPLVAIDRSQRGPRWFRREGGRVTACEPAV